MGESVGSRWSGGIDIMEYAVIVCSIQYKW
jgi:hypothetical protein